MPTDMGLVIDTVQLAMSMEHSRAKMAAHNIATANVPGSQAMRVNVDQPLAQLRGARGDAALFAQTLQSLQNSEVQAYQQTYPTGTPLALDGEVAELSAASGRYQALADGVSRQFGLMQLAIKGGR